MAVGTDKNKVLTIDDGSTMLVQVSAIIELK